MCHYSFSYRRPLLYTLIGVIALALLGAFAIERVAMHNVVGTLAEKHQVPLMAAMYEQTRNERPDGVTVGRVIIMQPQGFVLTNEYDEEITIVVVIKFLNLSL